MKIVGGYTFYSYCILYSGLEISRCPGARGTEIFSRAPRFSRLSARQALQNLGHVYFRTYPGTRILGRALRLFTLSARMALAKNRLSSSPVIPIFQNSKIRQKFKNGLSLKRSISRIPYII